jgi:hypothetical protein
MSFKQAVATFAKATYVALGSVTYYVCRSREAL